MVVEQPIKRALGDNLALGIAAQVGLGCIRGDRSPKARTMTHEWNVRKRLEHALQSRQPRLIGTASLSQ